MGRARAPGTCPPLPLLLSLLLLQLLLLSPNVQGDCGPPPDIPNATAQVDGKTSFPKNSFVVYFCNQGFLKIPNKGDTVFCLGNGQWSSLGIFCNKSCGVPLRVPFASLKKEYISWNYFPIGSTVEYECRPGFRRQPGLSGKSTCLENSEWSEVAEICKKKSCPNPGEIKNGLINITTDILFGSEIFFSCDTGYRLIGLNSVFCLVMGNTVDWSDPFPVCTEIFCPDPPKIANGSIRGEADTYVYRQVVTYVCAKGFILSGKNSIYCNVNNDRGEWSDSPPQCIEKSKIPPTTSKPTTVTIPSTRVPSTPQKTTTVNIPATQRVPVIKTTVHHPTRTSKDKERSTSDGDRLIYGHTCLITLTVLHAMLLLIG
ncbi:complement decay-accelerating factor isoform X2 [Sigmodon hispidus]